MPTLVGDVNGNPVANTVNKINGTDILTSAGSLLTGQVLRTIGTTGADWGPVDLANSDAVTSVLSPGNGGTGLSAIGSALQILRTNAAASALEFVDQPDAMPDGTQVGQVPRITVVGPPSTWVAGAVNLANSNAVTGISPYTRGGTGLSALGSAYQVLRTNSGATGMEWAPDSEGVYVANLTALAALTTTPMRDGQLAYVVSLKSYFMLDSTSALTADGITILAATSGRWLRMDWAHPYWKTVTTWHIDVAGSDENVGATSGAGNALKTHAELMRRWGVKPKLPVSITVNVDSNLPSTDPINLDVLLADGTALAYVGTATNGRTGTFTSVVARVPSTNTPNSVADTGIADWTADLNKRVKITSGTRSGSYCWVDKDLGSNAARITELVLTDPPNYDIVPKVQVTSDPYVIQTLCTVYAANIKVDADSLGIASFTFQDFRVTGDGSGTFQPAGSANMNFSDCRFDNEVSIFETCPYLQITNCNMVLGITGYTGRTLIFAGSATKVRAVGGGAFIHIGTDILVKDYGAFADGGCNIDIGEAGFVDCATHGVANPLGSAIYIRVGGCLTQHLYNTATRYIWGSGSAGYGIQVAVGANVGVVNQPYVTGTSGNAQIAGSTSARAFDEDLGTYTELRSLTWANFWADVSAGGFSKGAHNVSSNGHIVYSSS